MNDFNYSVQDLTQYASGYITYGNPVEAEFASGSITYGTPIAAQFASIQISVVDYTQLVGKTVTIDGQVLTEGVDFTAAVDNDTTGTSLAAAIHALANWTAAGPGLVVATWVARGTVGNGKSVTTNASGGLDIAGGGVGGGVTTGGVTGDTVAVAGTTFTCVASAPGANEFTNITELEALVEAIANINSSQNGTVISITYATRGVAGNAVTLTMPIHAGTMAVSGATLTGGLAGDTVTVNGQLMTAVASAPGANEFSSIVELEALIEALASINSSQDGTTITINADAPGTAGNSITLALGGSNAGTMAISGATLSGGVAATYTPWFQIPEEASVVRMMLKVAGLTASGAVEATAQTSMDQENIVDLTTLRLEANGVQTEEVGNLLTWFRFKIGTDDGAAASPTADITISAQPATSSKEDEHEFYISSALEASAVAKEAPGLFYGIECLIDSTAASDVYYLFVYDAQTVPSNGATLDAAKLLMVPKKINHAIGTDSQASFDYDGAFKRASYGICWFIGTSDSLTLALVGSDIAKVTLEND